MARAEGGGLVGTVFFLFVDVPRPWAPESGGGRALVVSVTFDCCAPAFPFLPNGLFLFPLRFRRLPHFRLSKT